MSNQMPNNFNFENAVKELNEIVEKMEAGGLSLEDSLRNFEKGIGLTRQCKEILNAAEQKVKILMEKNGTATLENYPNDEEIA